MQLADIAIIKAKDEHANQIIDFIFNIWHKEYQFDVKKEDFPDLIHIDQYYWQAKGAFFIAICDKEIIGTIAYSQLDGGNLVLKRMFVEAKYRGHGVAQQLLDRLIAELPQDHQSISIYLSTKEGDAIAAKKFYLKNGFQIITKDELPVGFPYFYQDDLFMVKEIAL